MDSLAAPAGDKLKSYWNRPGGKFGTLVGLAILGASAYYLLPILAAIAWTGVNLVIGIVTLCVLLYAISHRKLRLGAFFLYEIAMKKLIGLVNELDPFIIMENLIDEQIKDRNELHEQIVQIAAESESTKQEIRDLERDKANATNDLRASAGTAREGVVARQIGRLEQGIEQLQPILHATDTCVEHLTKVYDHSAILIEDAQNELATSKRVHAAVTKSSKAMNTALRLVGGDPEKKLMAIQAADQLKDNIAGKMANIKLAMRTTKEFVASIDRQNGIYQQDALTRLQALSAAENFKLTAPTYRPETVPSRYDGLLS